MVKHLIPQLSPLADTNNTVTFLDYRITVLGQRLFRLEQDPSLAFNDRATQSVWFRNMSPQAYQTEKCDDFIRISTKEVTLSISKNFSESHIVIDGKCLPLENKENLFGTIGSFLCK